jgi:uncharacterized protein
VEPKFIVDVNIGKVARWLRMMGLDTLFFDGPDDGEMVKIALAEGRIIITRDTEFMKRRAVASGRVTALLVSGDSPKLQMETVMNKLELSPKISPFTRCIECNTVLQPIEKNEAELQVPPRVSEIQDNYMQCPACRRIYWRGTHWKAMNDKLHEFESVQPGETEGGLP